MPELAANGERRHDKGRRKPPHRTYVHCEPSAGSDRKQTLDELLELPRVATLDHGNDVAVRRRGAVAAAPVLPGLGVEPERVPGVADGVAQSGDGQRAVVGARVAEDEQ